MDGASTNTSANVLLYAAPRSRLHRALRVTIVVGVAYLASYAAARVTGVVIHYQTPMLYQRGGWWRGHEIAPGARSVPPATLLPLRPLMFAEELVRGAADRLAG